MVFDFKKYQTYVQILKEELVPATGCTEPIALSYCASKARDILQVKPKRCLVEVSGNIIKNVKSVVVPNTNGLKGIEAAVAAGIVAGDANKALEVIANIKDEEIFKIKEYLSNHFIEVKPLESEHILDIKITLYGDDEYVLVRIVDQHTNIVLIEKNNKIIPKIKISENTEKITNPGYKKVYRIFENETGKAIGDVIAFHDEKISSDHDLTIYHQSNIWKFKTLLANTYTIEELQVPIFIDGKKVYPDLTVDEIREYSKQEKKRIWDEVFRLEYPHDYYVDLTKELLDYKIKMLEEKRK